MNKYCIFQYLRFKNRQPYLYCKLKMKSITYEYCKKCQKREIKRNTFIKKKTSKLSKIEKNRYSILQLDNTKCYLCNKKEYLDKHEAFGGANRKTSIKWGLIYYLCRSCHKKAHLDNVIKQKLHDFAREEFIKKYGEEKFLSEFKKMYIGE